MPPTLRQATHEDAPAIMALVKAAYQHYVPLIGRTPIPMLTDNAAVVREHEVWVLDAYRETHREPTWARTSSCFRKALEG